MHKTTELFEFIKKHGLFLAPLNNGDWIAGRANTLYSLDITQDHYQDPRLSINADPMKALREAAMKDLGL